MANTIGTQKRLNGSSLVIACGIVLVAIGLFLLPIWSPLFAIGIALTWMGALRNSLEGLIIKRGRIAWYQLVIGAVLVLIVFYTIINAISDYGHSFLQRVGIVVATIGLHAIILHRTRASNPQTVASHNLVATSPTHGEQ